MAQLNHEKLFDVKHYVLPDFSNEIRFNALFCSILNKRHAKI